MSTRLEQILNNESDDADNEEELLSRYLSFSDVDVVAIQLASSSQFLRRNKIGDDGDDKEDDEIEYDDDGCEEERPTTVASHLQNEVKKSKQYQDRLDKEVHRLHQLEWKQMALYMEQKAKSKKKQYDRELERMRKYSVQAMREVNEASKYEWRRLEDRTKNRMRWYGARLVLEQDDDHVILNDDDDSNDYYQHGEPQRDITSFRGKRWRIEWTREPQILCFTFHALSSILGQCLDVYSEDTLVWSVSMYDRINGFEIGYSKRGSPSKMFKRMFMLNRKDNRRRVTCTGPMNYQDSNEKTMRMNSDMSLQFICPCNKEMHPRMVFLIELFSLTRNIPVAWTIFPAVNSDLSCLADGRYRSSMMKGELNKEKIGSFAKWFNMSSEYIFGNIYFSVSRIDTRDYFYSEQINTLNVSYSLEIRQDSNSDTRQHVLTLKQTAEKNKSQQPTWPVSSSFSPVVTTLYENPTFQLTDVDTIPSSLSKIVIEHNDVDYSSFKQSVKSEEHSWSKLPLYHEKAIYMYRTIVFDLGFQGMKMLETYLMILLLLIVFYARYWPHYFAQWVYIGAGKVPMIDPTYWTAYHVSVHFKPEYCTALYVVGYVYIGSLFNIFMFGVMGLSIAVLQSKYLFGTLPMIVYRIVLLYGICIIGDPVWIFLSDLIFQLANARGEAYYLSLYYLHHNRSLLPGLFLTLFIFAQVIALASIVVYQYSLRIHIHGRVWDIYRRLHASDEDLMIHEDEFVHNGFERDNDSMASDHSSNINNEGDAENK